MREQIDLLGFLTLGLLGGFGHCLGMCGPFVLYVSRRFGRGPERRLATLGQQLLYTLGRILTYAALGAAAGAVGGAVDLAGSMLGVQRAAAVVAGAVLILYGLGNLAAWLPSLSSAGGPLFQRVAEMLARRAPGQAVLTGLLLGLLPCGLVYSALIAATARGGPAPGATALLLFGVGTAPAMLGLSVVDELLARHRALLNKLSALFLLLMGGWFVWQGLRPG
jgi:hypothetical protein